MKRSRVWMTVMAAALLAACGDDAASSGTGGNGAGGGATTTSGGLCPGVDLDTDPENCGACGNECGGDTCSDGVCAAFQIAVLPSYVPVDPGRKGQIAATDTHLYVSSADERLFIVDLSDGSVTSEDLEAYAFELEGLGSFATYCLGTVFGNTQVTYQAGEPSSSFLGACRGRLGADGLYYFESGVLLRSPPEGGPATTLRTYSTDPTGPDFEVELPGEVAPVPSGGAVASLARGSQFVPTYALERITSGSPIVIADYGVDEPENLRSTEGFVYYTIRASSGSIRFGRTNLSTGAAELLQSSSATVPFDLAVHTDGSTAYLIEPFAPGGGKVYVVTDSDANAKQLPLDVAGEVLHVSTNAERLYVLRVDGTIVSAPKPN